ncbi:uncharacterized protein LOC129216352 [Uloborus diversus]|uniref:uncharacterized protein LOC129216352 n=1 Tax=Uloborus diversus TaxID=327109 RepID=UPI0024093DC4|nr:uncharacterized protein LOC129216352 [Uloborus diversus]
MACSKYRRSRHFELTQEQINAILFAESSGSECGDLDDEDTEFLESDIVNLGNGDHEKILVIIDGAKVKNTTENEEVEVVPETEKDVERASKRKRNATFHKQSCKRGKKQNRSYKRGKKEEKKEIYAYLGICYVMGYHVLPNLRDYWSTDEDLRVSLIARTMTYERFTEIRRFLHFNDNEKNTPNIDDENRDRAFKIRPLIEHFNKAFQEAVEPEECMSIDEHMIANM